MDRKVGRNTVVSALVLLVGMAPLVATWVYKVCLHPRPFWAFDYDPEAIYFSTGMQLLNGQPVWNVDNPGTPVQILSSGILLLVGQNPLDFDRFRLTAYLVSGLLTVAAAWVLKRTLLSGLAAPLQIACLWFYFLCAQALTYFTIWSPEALFFVAGSLALACLWPTAQRPSLGMSLLAGGGVGLCCALKFTFLGWVPALVLALALLPWPSTRVRLLGVLSGTLGVCLGFFLATAVVADRYGQMFAWLLRLATHSGNYGSGPAEAPSLSSAAANLQGIITSSKIWHAILLLLIGSVTAALIQRRRQSLPVRPWLALFVFALTALAISYLATLRSATLRYLLPTGLAGVLLLALAFHLWLRNRPRLASAAVLAVLACWLGKTIMVDLHAHDDRIQGATTLRDQLDSTLAGLSRGQESPVVVFSFRAPEPSLALRIMFSDPDKLNVIGAAYPRQGHVGLDRKINLTGTGAQRWDYLVLDDESRDLLPEEPPGTEQARVGRFRILRAPEAFARSEP